MQPIIYLIGRPYPHAGEVALMQQLGYRLGLFLDKDTQVIHPEPYEQIIPLDFSGTEPLASQLDRLGDIEVDGLFCLYENYILAKAEIGAFFQLPALSVDAARKSTDKHLMRAAFSSYNPAITPRHSPVSSEAEALAFARTAGYPLMLKPANLVKSLLVLRCNNQTELMDNYRYASEKIGELYQKYHVYGRGPQLIVEEFIRGKLCSVAAMIDGAGVPHFLEGICELTTAQDRGIADSYLYERLLPGEFKPSVRQKIFDAARAGIAALGLTSSSAHIELMHNGEDVKIVEIGARTGGYRKFMYQESYGIDLLEAELQLATGNTPLLDGSFKAYSSVVELFPESEGTFAGVSGDIHESDYVQFHIKAQPGQLIGPAHSGYKAAATAIAVSPDKQRLGTIRQATDRLRIEVNP